MTTQDAPAELRAAADQQRSIRPVIEHALTDYFGNADTARTLIDRLIREQGDQ